MLVLVGPSASGKTESAKLLIQKYGMHKLVTYTTRAKRINEIEGVDYHFISKDEFFEKIKTNFFLEYVDYNGNYYGTPIEGLDTDKVVILEANGLKHYCNHVRSDIKICYLRTSLAYRKKRMIARGDSEESIAKRLANDDALFNNEIEKLADWVIDSDKYNVPEMTEQIYSLYKEFIHEKA